MQGSEKPEPVIVFELQNIGIPLVADVIPFPGVLTPSLTLLKKRWSWSFARVPPIDRQPPDPVWLELLTVKSPPIACTQDCVPVVTSLLGAYTFSE